MSANNLTVNQLSVQFGGLKAVNGGVCFSLRPQSLAGLIGPNGAGKTTVFNALTGLCPISQGQVNLGEEDLTNQPAHCIARKGVARTFQNIRLFKDLTVMDNLRIAYHQNRQYSLLSVFYALQVIGKKKTRLQNGLKKS